MSGGVVCAAAAAAAEQSLRRSSRWAVLRTGAAARRRPSRQRRREGTKAESNPQRQTRLRLVNIALRISDGVACVRCDSLIAAALHCSSQSESRFLSLRYGQYPVRLLVCYCTSGTHGTRLVEYSWYSVGRVLLVLGWSVLVGTVVPAAGAPTQGTSVGVNCCFLSQYFGALLVQSLCAGRPPPAISLFLCQICLCGEQSRAINCLGTAFHASRERL